MRIAATTTNSAPVIQTRMTRDAQGRARACVVTIQIGNTKDRAKVSYEGLGLSFCHEDAAAAMARRIGHDGTRWIGAPAGEDKYIFVPVTDWEY